MYEFIKNMWIMKNYTVEQVNLCIIKGYIMQQQADEILAMEQIASN